MILNIQRPNPGGKAQIQEGKRTRMPSAPSCALPARFPAPRRGPQSAADTHRQHQRGITALSLLKMNYLKKKKWQTIDSNT